MKELPLLFVKKIVKSSRVNDSNNRFKTLIHKAEVDLIYHRFNIQKEKCHPDFFLSQTMLFTCLGFCFYPPSWLGHVRATPMQINFKLMLDKRSGQEV